MPLGFRAQQKDLSAGFQLVARALPSRPSVPALAGILVEAEASGLWLSATDLEVSLRVRVPASDLTPGRLVVPGHQTAELIRFLPEGEVAAEQADNSVLLRYARGQNQITTLDAQQFPAFPEPETGARITLDAQQWQALLKQVVIACGHDDVQPMFNGILWDLGPNRPLNLVDAVKQDRKSTRLNSSH